MVTNFDSITHLYNKSFNESVSQSVNKSSKDQL